MLKVFILGLLIGFLVLWTLRNFGWGGDDWGRDDDDIRPGPRDPGEMLDPPESDAPRREPETLED